MTQLSNYVQLIGHVGNEVELSKTKNENPFVNLSLATNESYMDKTGQWETKTQWHKLICWGQLAERVCNQIQKGDQLLVRGKLQYRKYEDSQHQLKYITQIVVDNFIPMKKKELTTATN